jgi:hypothetical protein
LITLYSEYSLALTSENLCQPSADAPGNGGKKNKKTKKRGGGGEGGGLNVGASDFVPVLAAVYNAVLPSDNAVPPGEE